MTQFICETMWIYKLLTKTGLQESILARLWCDNQAIYHISFNPMFHKRNKHIEIESQFVQEKVQQILSLQDTHVQKSN